MRKTRRWFCSTGAAVVAVSFCPTLTAKMAESSSRLDLIDAPTNLGLRPNDRGALPGTAKATKALRAAGLDGELRFRNVRHITPLAYDRVAQASTHIRNGQSLRIFDLKLAHAVAESIDTGGFPIVLGGDCSNLLGGLLGLRWAKGRGLVHIDGHSDFIHPGNYDLTSRLGSAAGMDLALATGRGESLLTVWPGIEGPLVADSDVVQLGERNRDDPDYVYRDNLKTKISQLTVQEILKGGIDAAIEYAVNRLSQQRLDAAWLHVDVDVLDQRVMPAVDSPGTPGLAMAQLKELIIGLCKTGRVAGADVSIYDPDLDPTLSYARELVQALAAINSVRAISNRSLLK